MSRSVWCKPVLLLIAALAAGYTLVIAILAVVFTRRVLIPQQQADEPIVVLQVNHAATPATVTLTLGEYAALAGRFSFVFDGGSGHAKVGEVLAVTATGVVRELVRVDQGTLLSGVKGRISGWWYAAPEELGHPVTELTVKTAQGEFPAWSVVPRTADRSRCVIHIHGRGARREETLRSVAVCAEAGLPSLVVSYRNDPEARTGARGTYGFGTDEWEDVEGAIREAVMKGAQRLTLVGWSMGGTIALLAAERSAYRHQIDSLVLESPAVSWPGVLAHHARLSHVPKLSVKLSMWLLERGAKLTGRAKGIPIHTLTPERFARGLRVPTLVLSSPFDTYVPDGPVARFKKHKPELVTWVRVNSGEHVKIWNVAEKAWTSALKVFLTQLPT